VEGVPRPVAGRARAGPGGQKAASNGMRQETARKPDNQPTGSTRVGNVSGNRTISRLGPNESGNGAAVG
jgi:hypothetical protein